MAEFKRVRKANVMTWVTDEQKDIIKKAAAADGRSVADWVRLATLAVATAHPGPRKDMYNERMNELKAEDGPVPEPSPPQQAITRKPNLAICVPATTFPLMWVYSWSHLLSELIVRFNTALCFATSSNIYYVRNSLAASVCKIEPCPDYVLWIDSDNVVSFEGVDKLFKAIIKPGVDAVGAWYWVQTPGEPQIAAGHYCGPDRKSETRLDPAKILTATDLIEVDYIGFGALLMKGEVVKKLGPKAFNPGYYLEDDLEIDDASFCHKAKQAGYHIYLHPGVHVPHLKMVPIGPPVS
jgi:hypothetical protein